MKEDLRNGRIDYIESTKKEDDLEIEQIDSEIEDYESGPPEYEISTYPADFTLEVLYNKWKSEDKEIIIPEFQRQFVWKQVQASKLIESFLVGLPVPPVYFYKERKEKTLLVIDGQQRLKSIFFFFEGYFGDEEKGKREVFHLKGLSEASKYNNKTFEELAPADKKDLKNSVLRAFIVNQLDPSDDTSMYHIFERLNTGGTLLTNQEIRNCVYRGNLMNLLVKLNKVEIWRNLLGKPIPDSRQRDVELILRFFALVDFEHYEKPLKEWLTKFLKRNRNPSDEFLTELEKLFIRTCEIIYKSIGVKPFHLRRGVNSAAFDAIMIAFSKNSTQIPLDIIQRYEKLKEDDDFNKWTSGGTTDEDAIKGRIRQAINILFRGNSV